MRTDSPPIVSCALCVSSLLTKTAGTGSAPAATPEKSGEVQRLSSFRVDVQARLAVSDREAAERAVRDLVGRAGGRVLARTDEGSTTVLILAVPRDRWEDVRGGLQALGPLQLEGRGDDAARQLVFTLRLAR